MMIQDKLFVCTQREKEHGCYLAMFRLAQAFAQRVNEGLEPFVRLAPPRFYWKAPGSV